MASSRQVTPRPHGQGAGRRRPRGTADAGIGPDAACGNPARPDREGKGTPPPDRKHERGTTIHRTCLTRCPFWHTKQLLSDANKPYRIPFTALSPLAFAARLLAFCAILIALAVPAPAQDAPERLTFAFQRQKDPRALKPTADKVAEFLSKEIGIPVDVMIPASYGATVQAIVSGKVQIAYLSSIPMVLAREEAPVELLLAEQRNGATDYSSVVLVKKDAPYKTLADLKGQRMAWTGATSASGYVFPWARLVELGLVPKGTDPKPFFASTVFAGGYDKALLALANGQADACAVSDYVIEGPKADLYGPKEQRDQFRILERIPGVPTHGIAARTDLAPELRGKVKAALLKLSAEQPELLADVYGAATFVEATTEGHLKGALDALDRTGLAAKSLVE